MKNYSARKLLMMFANGQHMPYCQRTSFPIAECSCFKHEVKSWKDKIAASAKARVRKPTKSRPRKTHMHMLIKCGKHGAKTSTDINEVTCKRCLKALSRKAVAPVNPPSNTANYVSFASP